MFALSNNAKLHNITTPVELLPCNTANHVKYSQSIVTGIPTTVAIKYKDGIVLAANPVSRSGSSLKNKDVERFTFIGPNMVFSGSGDQSDFQKLTELLQKQWFKDSVLGTQSSAKIEIYSHYLSQLCYQKRNKIDPYLVSSVLAGYDRDGNARLYSVDQYGALIEKEYFTTGFGGYFLPPLVGRYIININYIYL